MRYFEVKRKQAPRRVPVFFYKGFYFLDSSLYLQPMSKQFHIHGHPHHHATAWHRTHVLHQYHCA